MSNGNKNGVEPTILVVFGATGDLAQRKLYPALFDLFVKGLLPKKFAIRAMGRRKLDEVSYRAFIREIIGRERKEINTGQLAVFVEAISYTQGLFEDERAYGRLGEALMKTDEKFNVCSNKLFYLAVPPNLYETILHRLSKSGLTIPCGNGEGWTRILIEKPFGKDTETARRLDRLLGKLFQETQIFRIDHYLAKETIQNILTFRFANALFEPIWNAKHIERIEIRMFEKDTVGARGSLYEGLGALRDVGQNHLLAMLSLVTMEYPRGYSAQSIRKERSRALKELVPVTGAALRKIIKGQYEGYKAGEGVNPDSTTETFFSLNAYMNSKRWKGVPIELSGGKALSENKTEINIYFKDVNCGAGDITSNRNVLTFRIQPNEGISILFWIKKPGFVHETHPQVLSFNYADAPVTAVMPDAYERVLLDSIRGDQTLFASTEETEAAWKFITPILERWGNNPLKIYARGSSLEQILKNGK